MNSFKEKNELNYKESAKIDWSAKNHQKDIVITSQHTALKESALITQSQVFPHNYGTVEHNVNKIKSEDLSKDIGKKRG